MFDYAIQKESEGWSVWTCAPMTGDRRNFVGHYRTKRDALRAIDRLREDAPKTAQQWPTGRTVKQVRAMTPQELYAEGWGSDMLGGEPTVIEFDDGSTIYASQDDEGNGAGALFGYYKGNHIRLIAPR